VHWANCTTELTHRPILAYPWPKGQPFDTLTACNTRRLQIMSSHPNYPTWGTLYSASYTIRPLISLPVLLKHPPDFIPSEKFTEERREKWISTHWVSYGQKKKIGSFPDQGTGGSNNLGSNKCGNFRKDYFQPIIYQLFPHAWVECNIPIPRIYDESQDNQVKE